MIKSSLIAISIILGTALSTSAMSSKAWDSLYDAAIDAHRAGVYELVEINFNLLLEEAVKSGNQKDELAFLLHLTEARRASGQLETSHKTLERAKVLIQNASVPHNNLIARYYNRSAALYYELKKLDSSLYFAYKSLDFCEEHEIKAHYSSDYNIIGAIYRDRNKADSAMYFLKKALRLAINAKDTSEVIGIALNITIQHYKKQEQCDSIIYYAELAKDFAESAGYTSALVSIYNYVSAGYLCNRQFEPALYYENKESILKDSLQNENSQRRIAAMTALHNVKYEHQRNELLQERLSNQRIFTMAGGLVLLLLIVLVVSETRRRTRVTRLNKKLEKQAVELQKNNALNATVMGVLAHDLRSPMNAVSAVLFLLEAEGLTQKEQKELIAKLNVQFNLTQGLLDNLLQWSKYQLNGITVKKDWHDVQDLVNHTIKPILSIVQEKRLTLNTTCPSNISAWIDGDIFSLVLRNLLTNAVKFSHENSTIFIGISSTNETLELTVRDQGVGMNKKQISDLYSDKSESQYGTSNEKGTGLGLRLCEHFTKEHGGNLIVQSEVGKGTTFTVTFVIDKT